MHLERSMRISIGGFPGRGPLGRSPWRRLAALCLVLALALAPAIAEARAGSSGRATSQGSRGSHTYSDNGARPMERSLTPQSAPRQAAPAPAPGYAYNPGYRSTFFGHPFMTGFMGGLLGAGLAGMLFGHSAWAADGGGAAGMLGLLLQFALIGGLVWLLLNFLRRRAASGPASFAGALPLGFARGLGGSAPAPQSAVAIPIGDGDFNAWSGLLTGIQDAWSRGDLALLKRLVTPEMLSYFAEELAANQSRGVENRVEAVTLLKGDLEEAWSEGDLDYATARLTWSARDYMVQPPSRAGEHEVIVAGDPVHAVEATEVWTFLRRRGGAWLLSAIQQVR